MANERTVAFRFKPGINREITNYGNEGGYWDCDKMRFHMGAPEKIGGWSRLAGTAGGQFDGICRALHAWTTNSGESYIAVGTHTKLYVSYGGTLHDITPLRTTVTLGASPFATTNGSTTVTVTHTSHGATVGSFVTYSGATTFNNVTIDGEYEIQSVIDANSYTITSATTANATGSGGGAAVSAAYQINIGDDSYIPADGWGAGGWGESPWGGPYPSGSVIVGNFRLWFFDNWGEDLVATLWNGAVYYWDSSVGFGQRAVLLTSLSGSTEAPEVSFRVLISDTDRHAVAFGADDIGGSSLDPLLIRWSDTEDIADWNPTEQNAAGSLRISQGSKIVAAIRARQEFLIWTDISVHSLQFVGNDFIFGTAQVGENISIIGPNAAVSFGDVVYWMGLEGFWVYAGGIRTLPCTVRDYVFGDINLGQSAKVFAGTNAGFNEVIWLYPSGSSNEIDRYVIYNTSEQVWYFGTLPRTAWLDRGENNSPVAASTDGYLYEHDSGLDDGSTNPPSAINAYIQSCYMDIGDGHHLAFVDRIIPDLTLFQSTSLTGTLTYSLLPRYAPGSAPGTQYDKTVSVTNLSADSQFTSLLHVRVRARQVALKVASNSTGLQWRLGATRLSLRPDGRKS